MMPMDFGKHALLVEVQVEVLLLRLPVLLLLLLQLVLRRVVELYCFAKGQAHAREGPVAHWCPSSTMMGVKALAVSMSE